MNRLSLKELEEIKKPWEASTPGPFIEGRYHTSGSDFIRTSKNDIELSGASLADQDFIANAKQDIPRLIAEIELLWKIMPNIE
ncbi:hypothetical protein LEP1GSC021_3625 [Leptospira noguchii str. 1993005606]|uniref:Uncharacterized protein n=2 Tax=Leptospira noguchii TaxID=28182 RepID=M6YBD5_9LEPT|nr:hypothetical protein [Leptospira noguchii]EMM99185.1 hypothetical protein LEP1GSC035_3000 [Leptospira noguchii str. 2007001578]EMO86959.1 hypothetical protein LEP1GSC024_4696 [Leptospira noguchii str. 2001034031]EPE84220.1 hypothetical protein LEP1GSC021_3625 [Leptospira noguchii str. 1993005606]